MCFVIGAETGEREVVIQGNYSMVLCVGESRDCPEVIRNKFGNRQRVILKNILSSMFERAIVCKLTANLATKHLIGI